MSYCDTVFFSFHQYLFHLFRILHKDEYKYFKKKLHFLPIVVESHEIYFSNQTFF